MQAYPSRRGQTRYAEGAKVVIAGERTVSTFILARATNLRSFCREGRRSHGGARQVRTGCVSSNSPTAFSTSPCPMSSKQPRASAMQLSFDGQQLYRISSRMRGCDDGRTSADQEVAKSLGKGKGTLRRQIASPSPPPCRCCLPHWPTLHLAVISRRMFV